MKGVTEYLSLPVSNLLRVNLIMKLFIAQVFFVIYFLLYRVDAFSVLSRPVRQWSNKTQYFCSASITAYPDIPRG